jgi:hypothetical protein
MVLVEMGGHIKPQTTKEHERENLCCITECGDQPIESTLHFIKYGCGFEVGWVVEERKKDMLK